MRFARTILCVLAACAIATQAEEPASSMAGRTMGTTFTVKWVITAERPMDVSALEARIEASLHRLDSMLSTYRPKSDLSLFNASRSTNWQSAPIELVEVLDLAHAVSTASEGAFDVTVGPLVDLWGFGPAPRPEAIPSAAAIAAAQARVGFWKIETRHVPLSIRKQAPDVACDLSGIAKGYAVDQICALLDAAGIERYLAEIGGELRARGESSSGGPWRIGIRDPATPSRLGKVLPLRDAAMATSGDYFQFFELGGVRYTHTLDPRTGHPIPAGVASVTVVHATCAEADAWATGLGVLGPEHGLAMARDHHLAVLMFVRGPDGMEERTTPAFERLLGTTPDLSPQ